MSENSAVFSEHIKFTVQRWNNALTINDEIFDAKGQRISNAATPEEENDVATKEYVDNRIAPGTVVTSAEGSITITEGSSFGGVEYVEGNTYLLSVRWTISGETYPTALLTITSGVTRLHRVTHEATDHEDDAVSVTLVHQATDDNIVISNPDRVAVSLTYLG